eukprot:EG_transcript_17713
MVRSFASGNVAGVSSLYRGLAPAVMRHWVYTGARVALYEQLRNTSNHQNWGFMGQVVSGGVAGGLGQFLASPTDLLKVRLQTDQQATYRGPWQCVRSIYTQEGGILAFWRGWLPNVQRAVAVNVGQLVAYDRCKQLLLHHSLPDGTACHALASLGAGFFGTLCSAPFDVLKTRLMQTGSGYRGAWHCGAHTLRTEGVCALYKGFFPAWARLGPWQLIFWVSYEKLRQLAGFGGF